MKSSGGKKCWLAAGVSFVIINVFEFVFHNVGLKAVYEKDHYQGLWNSPEAMGGRMWAMFLAYAIVAVLFTGIYGKGYETGKPPLGQGLRYGGAMGLLLGAHHALISYMVYPVSFKLALAWWGGAVALFLLLGAVVSALYKPEG